MLSLTTHWVYDEDIDSSGVKSGVATFVFGGEIRRVSVKSFDDYWKIKELIEFSYVKGAKDKAAEVSHRLIGI